MAVTDSLIGTVFDGRYRIVSKLGAGGMADVYLAEDQELGRQVAIKILNTRHAGDQQFVERFRMEASNAARLSHPNIVAIYDRGEAEGTYYIAMEYLQGRTLKDLIRSRGACPVALAIDYARQILAAVGAAHENGIVHRDIKPHNVVVDGQGRLKVTDFGIARAGASEMTEAGSIIGTAQYLSPEQARGVPADDRSDIYSVGVVLYELLTGTLPFQGDTPVEIAMKHLSAVPEPPSRRRPPEADPVPHELDVIVLRALAKRPEDRYPSAAAMDAELDQAARGLRVSRETEEAATAVLSGVGVREVVERTQVLSPLPETTEITSAGSAPPLPPAVPPVRRRRQWWPWLLGIGALAAVGIGVWYAYTQIQDQINQNKPVAVPYVVGLRAPLAGQAVQKAGLRPTFKFGPDEKVEKGYVVAQDPLQGERIDRGNTVVITVSTGKPQTLVPDVKGQSVAAALTALQNANLRANVVEIVSGAPANTVTATDPAAGARVPQGTVVRVNVSKGPPLFAVPSVVGEQYDQANSDLQAAGFTSARTDVDSGQPTGTVILQDPAGGSKAQKGATVTLSVSKGPPQLFVPDVTGQTQADATTTLAASGFAVTVVQQAVTDPTQDGIVLATDPPPGGQAPKGASVQLTVGLYANSGGGQTIPGAGGTTTQSGTTTPGTTGGTTSGAGTTGTTGTNGTTGTTGTNGTNGTTGTAGNGQ